jgi:hypothetical protein
MIVRYESIQSIYDGKIQHCSIQILGYLVFAHIIFLAMLEPRVLLEALMQFMVGIT